MTKPTFGLDRIKLAAEFLDDLHSHARTDPDGVEKCLCGDYWRCPNARHIAKLKEGIEQLEEGKDT